MSHLFLVFIFDFVFITRIIFYNEIIDFQRLYGHHGVLGRNVIQSVVAVKVRDLETAQVVQRLTVG